MKRTYIFLVFSLISVCICQNCQNFSKNNVTFNATNFEYILHWSKHNLEPDVSFNVQYKRYGQKEWLLLQDCQNITRVYCNLTNAISGDVEDFMDNQYFGRVRALSTNCTSDWVMSKRLNPREDTYMILPKLTYIAHVNSITILVPMPYVPIRDKDMQQITVEDLYKNYTFEYHLNFYNPEKQVTWQKTQTDRLFEVTGLSPDMEYNGNVYISIDKEQRSDKQFFVVRTLPDYYLIILITSLVAVFFLALFAGIFLLSCKYIKPRVQTPNSLVFQKSAPLPPLTLPKDKVISSCTVGFSLSKFIQNYEQKHQETSRKIWQEIPGNSQLQPMYTSQSHAVNTQESYCPQENISSSVSSVHYSEVRDMTTSDVTYLQNTTSNACSKVLYNSEEELQTNTQQLFVDYDEDVSKAFIDHPFAFDLFSTLLSKDSKAVLSSVSPVRLMSSVTVRDDVDCSAQIGHSPVLLSDLQLDGSTSNQLEEHNLHHSLLGHDRSSYTLQCPVKPTTDTLDRTMLYKKQCIL